MNNTLKNRKMVTSNLEKMLKSVTGKNKLQTSLFDAEPVEIKLDQPAVISPLELLEQERDTLGLVASVEYIRSDNMVTELFGMKRLSDSDFSTKVGMSIAICLGFKSEMSSYGPRYFVVFGDSIIKIDVQVPEGAQYSLLIGELYNIKYTQRQSGKETYFKLIKSRKFNRYTNGNNFKNGYLSISSEGNDKSKLNEFVAYIKMLENKDDGVKALFNYGRSSFKTRLLMDCEIYDRLKNYFKLDIKWKKLKQQHST